MTAMKKQQALDLIDGFLTGERIYHTDVQPLRAYIESTAEPVNLRLVDALRTLMDAVLMGHDLQTDEDGEKWADEEQNAINLAGDVLAAIDADKHPDDVAVDKFSAAMKAKLALARAKGRGGWETADPADLSRMLREHAEKGDPRDVANFCCFLWNIGVGISPASNGVHQTPLGPGRISQLAAQASGNPNIAPQSAVQLVRAVEAAHGIFRKKVE